MKKIVLLSAFALAGLFSFAGGSGTQLSASELNSITGGRMDITCERCECNTGTGVCVCTNCTITITP